jgi:hypothetical protein
MTPAIDGDDATIDGEIRLKCIALFGKKQNPLCILGVSPSGFLSWSSSVTIRAIGGQKGFRHLFRFGCVLAAPEPSIQSMVEYRLALRDGVNHHAVRV